MPLKNPDKNTQHEIIIEENLKNYFFKKLNEANARSKIPVIEEAIFYSSDVLERYSLAKNYFEVKDGKTREKSLGVKLLSCSDLSLEQKKRALKDIGDTALCLCGQFPKSVDKKLLDLSYYEDLGKIAYLRLNSLIPDHLDMPRFFHFLSASFVRITTLISSISDENFQELNVFKEYQQWVDEKSPKSEEKLKSLGIILGDNTTKSKN